MLFISSVQKWIASQMTFNGQQLYIILKLIVFSVHLNGFYTHLNAIAIEKVPLNIVLKYTYTILLPFPEVNNSSRDFTIDTNLILF